MTESNGAREGSLLADWPNEPTDEELAQCAELPPGDEGTEGAPGGHR